MRIDPAPLANVVEYMIMRCAGDDLVSVSATSGGRTAMMISDLSVFYSKIR